MRPFQRQLTRQPARLATPSSYRPFASATRLRLKEDQPNTQGRAEEIEKAKQEQKQKGVWKEELASSGEANVKADKQNVQDHDEHMEDLQKQTANQAQKEHPDAK